MQSKHIPSMLFTLVVLLLFTGCHKKPPDEDLPVQTIFERHECSQLKKYQMKLVAAGIPEKDEIDQIALHYVAFRKMEVPQVRKLIVSCVEELLTMVNNDQQVILRLKKHPITYEKIKFNIGFGTIDGEFQQPPYVAYAYLEEGVIHYGFLDEFFGKFTDEEDLEESYETAYNLVYTKS